MDPLERFVTVVRNNPSFAERFAPGASAAELDGFAAKLGLPVPPELRAFYTAHNGNRREYYDEAANEYRDENHELFPEHGILVYKLDAILLRKAEWDERHAEFERWDEGERTARFSWGFWNPSFIPFATDQSARMWAVATSPCFGGPAGQVIQFDYQGRDFWEIEHASFGDWLLTTAALLEEEVPAFDPREDRIRRELNPNAAFVKMAIPPQPGPGRFATPQTRKWT